MRYVLLALDKLSRMKSGNLEIYALLVNLKKMKAILKYVHYFKKDVLM